MDPLVSVLMPCYNATATLGMALASLQAQTYQNWECILVDDGSTDSPDLIVEQFRDSRIRYTRLDSNKGRSYARGLSTSLAKGDLLAMVDADDWIYPDKLEKQVEVMTADPSVTVVGTGIGIVDSRHNLAGVRAQGPCPQAPVFYGTLSSPQVPPWGFATSMYRARDVAGLTFNMQYRLAEDVDYMLRLALGKRYAIIPDVKYIYTEYDSANITKVLIGLDTVQDMLRQYNNNFPVWSRYLALKTFLKKPIYWGADRLGLWNKMISRRSRPPNANDLVTFSRALATVRASSAAFSPAWQVATSHRSSAPPHSTAFSHDETGVSHQQL